jgi:hypothetical protein
MMPARPCYPSYARKRTPDPATTEQLVDRSVREARFRLSQLADARLARLSEQRRLALALLTLTPLR